MVPSLGFMDSMAVAYLSAVAMGHKRYLCVLSHGDLEQKARGMDVVAYTVNSIDAERVFAEHAKVKGPFSIMGGPHPTFHPESLEESGADAYCIGEGEAAFGQVLRALRKGQGVEGIRSIETATYSPPLQPLADLDMLPMPDRDLMLSNTFLGAFPRKTFFTSRGCPFKCSYCFNPAFVKMYKERWCRRFSVDRVIREIQAVRRRYPLEFVKFDDDCFALKADAWLEEFAERYNREIGIPFNCLLRLDHASEEMLGLLAKAGCHSITTSIDSASAGVREEVLHRDMPRDNDRLVRALRRIKRHGMKAHVNFITAVPGASAEDEIESIRINNEGGVTYGNYTTLVPFQGIEIWDRCEEMLPEGFRPDSLVKPTALSCFTRRERRVQRNVLLLGAWGALMPRWMLGALELVIRYVPPNPVFVLLFVILKNWQVSRKIYPCGGGFLSRRKADIRSLVSNLKAV